MFRSLISMVDDTLDVASDTFDYITEGGSPPSRAKVCNLIEDGLSIAAVAVLTGYTTDMIEELISE